MIRVSAHAPVTNPGPVTSFDDKVLDAALRRPQRQQALKRSGLMTRELDESFDALTRLAATLLEAPVAFVGVATGDHDFYKSICGAPEPLASERVLTGRTFCHYTMAAGTPLVIDDTRAMAPWNQVPTVQTMGVAAYIGVPIVLDGEVVASLCVIDTVPRAWRDRDIEAMVQLALSAQRELTLRSALALATDRLHTHESTVARAAHHLRGQAQVLQLCAIQMRRGSKDAQTRAIARLDGVVDELRLQLIDLQNEALNEEHEPETVIPGGDLLRESIKMMYPLAERRGIHLSCDVQSAARCRVAHGRMLRVLNTLLGEIIRAVPADTQMNATLIEMAGQLHFVISSTARSEPPGGDDALEEAPAAPASWTLADTLLRRHGGQLRVDGDLTNGLVVTAVINTTAV